MNDTENKVKSKIESYEIKTTSTDILNAYNKEKEVKNRKPFFFHKSFFKIALPVSLSLASVIIAFSVYININKLGSNDNGNDFVTLNTKENNLLNKEVNLLAYGLNNKANYSTNNLKTILSNSFNSNNTLDDDSDPVTTTLSGYQDKVDKLDTTALAFYYLDNKLDTKISSIDYTKNIKYVSGNKTYKRKSEYYLNNTKIYDFIMKSMSQAMKIKINGI